METILVVDNDPHIRKGLRDFLSNKYNVITTSMGEDAIGLIHTSNIDLVITELNLEDITGFQLLNEINKKIPIIIYSSALSEVDQLKSYILGAVHCVTKPCSNSSLYYRVCSTLSLWQTHSKDIVNVTNDLTSIEDELFKLRNRAITDVLRGDSTEAVFSSLNMLKTRISEIQTYYYFLTGSQAEDMLLQFDSLMEEIIKIEKAIK